MKFIGTDPRFKVSLANGELRNLRHEFVGCRSCLLKSFPSVCINYLHTVLLRMKRIYMADSYLNVEESHG